MTFKIQVEYDQGEESGKILAIAQAGDINRAIDLALGAVRKSRGPGALCHATGANQFNQHVVLIADGEKPVWLTRTDAEDLEGQTTMKGTKPGDGAKAAK